VIIYYDKIYKVDVIIILKKKAVRNSIECNFSILEENKAACRDIRCSFNILEKNIDIQRRNWTSLYIFSKANTEPRMQSVIRRAKGLTELDLIEEKLYECERTIYCYDVLSSEFSENVKSFDQLIALSDFVDFTPEVFYLIV
jgi:hypothetical protein